MCDRTEQVSNHGCSCAMDDKSILNTENTNFVIDEKWKLTVM